MLEFYFLLVQVPYSEFSRWNFQVSHMGQKGEDCVLLTFYHLLAALP